jgi:Zn-dependent alcohol dehydrogenase
MNADSLADAQSKEPAIKTAIAGAGGVGEDTVTVAFEAASRRLLATSVYKARERVATLLGPSAWPQLLRSAYRKPPSATAE